jgi:hypothetical protein
LGRGKRYGEVRPRTPGEREEYLLDKYSFVVSPTRRAVADESLQPSSLFLGLFTSHHVPLGKY